MRPQSPSFLRPDAVFRRVLAAFLLLALVQGLVQPVTAQSNLAGLVIDYGNGNVTFAVVPFEGESISGIDVLRSSGLSLVSIPFGGLGEGVCSIEDHGCGVGDCRRLCQTSNPNSPFWHFYILSDDGWVLQPRGASGATSAPGDIQGWSWTDDEPALPELSLETLKERAGFSEQADEPAARTLDAAGSIVAPESDDPPWIAYGVTALVLILLVSGLALATRRRALRGTLS